MKFLSIGDAKLKIVLTSEDVKEYRIDLSSCEVRSENGRRGLWQIIDKARASVGFDPDGDKILIQFYPLADGGCELFVTKLGILSDSSARIVSKSERVTMLSKKQSFYCFRSLLDLSFVCREICRRMPDASPESELYYDGASFYLGLCEYGAGYDTSEFPFISEFGTSVSSECGAFLAEHFELLIKKDAVKVLSEL